MKKTLLLLILFIGFLANAQEPYYNNVDLTAEGSDLKDELATKTIAAHTNFLSYNPDVWNALKATDVNPTNAAEVLLIYGFSAAGTTARTRGVNSNGGGTGDWNREHTYPQSLGTPSLGSSSGAGVDAHHLRPSDVSYNSQRGSLKFADGAGNSGSVSGGWYPGDEWKGDVARMMMYMYLHYNTQCLPSNVGIGSTATTGDEMIDLFLEWNVEDPVSDFERQRNTYHENTVNTYAQGNRNPFIDNAYLATRIWGGDAAIDSWGIYTSTDTEAPTVPTNVVLNNTTTVTIDASWNASTDNVAVTKYEVFANGTLNGETATTSYTVVGLIPNTTYTITVLAKDIANNKSAQSTAANATTLTDTTPPTIPNTVTITNIGGTSFKVNWAASTDDTGVVAYDVFIDGTLAGTTANTFYNATGLTVSTTYSVTVLAKDAANNTSNKSNAVNGTTTDGSNSAQELFISEYVEGSFSNKAIEIVNITGNAVNLAVYSIKRQSNGIWETPLTLSGSIAVNDVFVIINSAAEYEHLKNEQDLATPDETPMNFNGDDRVGLFKNNVLIDIVGDLDGTSEFGANITLRRNDDITKPNIVYSEQGEWTYFPQNTVNGIGSHTTTASVNNIEFGNFKMYPNPTDGNSLFFSLDKDATIEIYNILGKSILKHKLTNTDKKIDITKLNSGVYVVKIKVNDNAITKKLIKK
jgi:endonuclease I/chitodextrinase